MKCPYVSVLAGIGGPLILASTAQAGFTGIKVLVKPNRFALTYNVYATFDERPGDQVLVVAGLPGAPLNISVRGGTYYQHPSGGDMAPDSALFAVFPSLAYDTFVTIEKKTSQGDYTRLAPGWPGFGPDRLAMSNSGWFIPGIDVPQGHPNANGQVLLAQLSTQDGTGFFGTMLVSGSSNGVTFHEVVSFDTQQAPVPGAAALLGAAGLLLRPGRRRRRRSPDLARSGMEVAAAGPR